jgi:hypothetical protein
LAVDFRDRIDPGGQETNYLMTPEPVIVRVRLTFGHLRGHGCSKRNRLDLIVDGRCSRLHAHHDIFELDSVRPRYFYGALHRKVREGVKVKGNLPAAIYDEIISSVCPRDGVTQGRAIAHRNLNARNWLP